MIRLYGTTQGQGSFSRVTFGMRQALKELGVLDGVVPLDAYDPEEAYPGWDAPVAVYVGDPRGVGIMTTVGHHRLRYVLLPPNSSWMPAELLAHVAKSATTLLAPSRWALEVQQRYVGAHGMETALWQHGVDARFVPDAHEQYQTMMDYPAFRVLHMTSTVGDRKGTRELVQAWTKVRGQLGGDARLSILANHGLVERALRGEYGPVGENAISWMARGDGFGVDAAARLYRNMHVVCQPSRGEGWGLVPGEARACGVPIVATACTGHADHVADGQQGVVVIPHGADVPTDDGPGAMSPSVDPEAIGEALVRAYVGWFELARGAIHEAKGYGELWSWKRVTEAWLETYGIRAVRKLET